MVQVKQMAIASGATRLGESALKIRNFMLKTRLSLEPEAASPDSKSVFKHDRESQA